MGLAPGTQAKGKRVGHEATKLLGFLLLLVCLFLLLLHDLRVPLLAGGSRKPVISALSLNRVALLFHILLAGELALVTAGHGDGSGSGLPPLRPLAHGSRSRNLLWDLREVTTSGSSFLLFQ